MLNSKDNPIQLNSAPPVPNSCSCCQILLGICEEFPIPKLNRVKTTTATTITKNNLNGQNTTGGALKAIKQRKYAVQNTIGLQKSKAKQVMVDGNYCWYCCSLLLFVVIIP